MIETLDPVKYLELDQYIQELGSKESELIAILHRAQHIFGYLPREVQEHIAKKINVTPAKIYGVVTFYSFFTMERRGKYVINVCLGTACFVRGAEKLLHEFEEKLGIKPGQTSENGKYTLSTLRCVGACGLAPVIQVNGKTYGNATIETVNHILEEYK